MVQHPLQALRRFEVGVAEGLHRGRCLLHLLKGLFRLSLQVLTRFVRMHFQSDLLVARARGLPIELLFRVEPQRGEDVRGRFQDSLHLPNQRTQTRNISFLAQLTHFPINIYIYVTYLYICFIHVIQIILCTVYTTSMCGAASASAVASSWICHSRGLEALLTLAKQLLEAAEAATKGAWTTPGPVAVPVTCAPSASGRVFLLNRNQTHTDNDLKLWLNLWLYSYINMLKEWCQEYVRAPPLSASVHRQTLACVGHPRLARCRWG